MIAFHFQVWFHRFPDVIGHGNTVTVEVHTEGGDDIGLGAIAYGCAQRLAGQHVGTIQFTGDDPVQQHFPVRLGFEFYE